MRKIIEEVKTEIITKEFYLAKDGTKFENKDCCTTYEMIPHFNKLLQQKKIQIFNPDTQTKIEGNTFEEIRDNRNKAKCWEYYYTTDEKTFNFLVNFLNHLAKNHDFFNWYHKERIYNDITFKPNKIRFLYCDYSELYSGSLSGSARWTFATTISKEEHEIEYLKSLIKMHQEEMEEIKTLNNLIEKA